MQDETDTGDASHEISDEITLDPEVTSAADGRWITELRERARASNRTVAELFDDSLHIYPPTSPSDERLSDQQPAPDVRPDLVDEQVMQEDDEVTIDRLATPLHDEPESPTPTASAPTPSAPTVAAPVARGPAAPPLPTVPAPIARGPAAPPLPTNPAPVQRGAPARWQPPPRLAADAVVTQPALLSNPGPSRPTWQPLAAAGVVLAAALLAVWLFAGRGGDPVDPPDSVVPTDTLTSDDPAVSDDPGQPVDVPDPDPGEQ